MAVHVTCPKCGTSFDAATSLQKHLEAELATRLATEQKALRETAAAEARAALANEAKLQGEELAAAKKQLQAAQAREVEVLRLKSELEQKAEAQKLEVARLVAAEQEKWAKAAADRARAEADLALRGKQAEIDAAQKQLQAAKARELEFLQQKTELEQKAAEQHLEVQRQVAAERDKWAKAAEERAKADAAVAMQAKHEEAEAAKKSLAEARLREAEWLKQKATLEDAARAQELALQQQLDAERARIRDAAKKEADTAAALREQENQEKLRQLGERLEEAQRRLAQGSQQAQGEAQEIVLEHVLQQAFPRDRFAEVEKGVEGADLVQTVRDDQGRDCGTILWESKRTKNWSPGWIGKLASDRARQNAHVAALATQALPPDVHGIGCIEDVWVCAFGQAVVLAALLRRGLVEAAAARLANAGRADKMGMVYGYLTGPEFRNRAMSMVRALDELRSQVDKERLAMQKIWAQRERLLQMAIGGVDGMRGDLQAIAGADLTALPGDGDGVRELEEVAGSGRGVVAGVGPGAGAGAGGFGGGIVGDSDEDVVFVDALRRAGGTSGNIRLRGELGWDEGLYERVKDGLVRRGVIVLGQGRGGSVRIAGTGEEVG